MSVKAVLPFPCHQHKPIHQLPHPSPDCSENEGIFAGWKLYLPLAFRISPSPEASGSEYPQRAAVSNFKSRSLKLKGKIQTL